MVRREVLTTRSTAKNATAAKIIFVVTDALNGFVSLRPLLGGRGASCQSLREPLQRFSMLAFLKANLQHDAPDDGRLKGNRGSDAELLADSSGRTGIAAVVVR